MTNIFSLFCMLLILASCDKQAGVELPSDDRAIEFGKSLVEDADFSTRGAIVDGANHLSMHVFCYNTGADQFTATTTSALPNWMYDAVVERTDNAANWTITNAGPDVNPFWQHNSYHSFFAFAPADIVPNENCSFSLSTDPGAPTFDYTLPADPVDHKDLLYSAEMNKKCDNTTGNPTDNATVNLDFKHALSKLTFEAQQGVYTNSTAETVTITQITFSNVHTAGTFGFLVDQVGTAATGNWTIATTSPTTTMTTTNAINGGLTASPLSSESMTNITAANGALMAIPQQFATNATMTIHLAITTTTTTTPEQRIFKLSEITQQGWEMGRSYNYQFTYNGAETRAATSALIFH